MLRLLRSEVRVPPWPFCDPTDKNLEILEIQTFDPQIRPKVQKLVRCVPVFALYVSGSVLIFTSYWYGRVVGYPVLQYTVNYSVFALQAFGGIRTDFSWVQRQAPFPRAHGRSLLYKSIV